jgi:hypothetical protein
MLLEARILGIRVKDQFKAFVCPVFFSGVMFALVHLLTRQLGPFEGAFGLIKLALIVSIGTAIYLLLVWLGKRELWNQLFLSMRRVLS